MFHIEQSTMVEADWIHDPSNPDADEQHRSWVLAGKF